MRTFVKSLKKVQIPLRSSEIGNIYYWTMLKTMPENGQLEKKRTVDTLSQFVRL